MPSLVSGVSCSVDGGNAFTAELKALEIGLSHAWELDIRTLSCKTDCSQARDVICTAMNITRYWERDLILKIRSFMERPWSVTITLISRFKNTAADFMARQAAWDGTPHKIWKQPSTSVIAAMCQDELA